MSAASAKLGLVCRCSSVNVLVNEICYCWKGAVGGICVVNDSVVNKYLCLKHVEFVNVFTCV